MARCSSRCRLIGPRRRLRTARRPASAACRRRARSPGVTRGRVVVSPHSVSGPPAATADLRRGRKRRARRRRASIRMAPAAGAKNARSLVPRGRSSRCTSRRASAAVGRRHRLVRRCGGRAVAAMTTAAAGGARSAAVGPGRRRHHQRMARGRRASWFSVACENTSLHTKGRSTQKSSTLRASRR